MKNILLICGSNRKGNTQYILETLNQNIENSEMILLRDNKIEYCRGCLACHKVNYCIIEDDINKIIDKLIKADLIIFGVPNYFDNVTGLFKNFMDRLHPLYKSELIANKKAIFIYVGGGNENGTKEELHYSIRGFVKYLKLDLIEEYSFKALNNRDTINQKDNIEKIIKEINNMIQ